MNYNEFINLSLLSNTLYNNFESCSIVEQSINIAYNEPHEKLVFD